MKRGRWLGLGCAIVAYLANGCFAAVEGDVLGAGARGTPGTDGGTDLPKSPPQKTDKVDLLFVVDDSSTMKDKQALLHESVPDLIRRLIRPNCVDERRVIVGQVGDGGRCDRGVAEFAPVRDLHVGFLSSSLGSVGGDACAPTQDKHGRLITRTEPGAPVLSTSSSFLTWARETPEAEVVDTFVKEAQSIIGGFGEDGCGYEAPLEAAYRFLVAPDPYAQLVKEGDQMRPDGFDLTLLAQRQAFLRPDSAVVVVLLSDESDASVAPTGFGGRAWFFTDSKHVRPGTTPCPTDPMSSACTSCYLAVASRDPACKQTLDNLTDHPNVRFFEPRVRFGADPRYPIRRYVDGFSRARVPSRNYEYDGFDYVAAKPDCTNPLFASRLPSGGSEELCALPQGTRTPDMIYFATITGVPWQLLTDAPDDLSAGSKASQNWDLGDSDYVRLLGDDAMEYRFTGQHPLMQESLAPRAGVAEDDAHGREWDTRGAELQYACTFELPTPRDCGRVGDSIDLSCDCPVSTDSPLCDPVQRTLQRRAKALPGLRQLAVARKLGAQALVGSICPREVTDPKSALYAYRPAMNALVDRISVSLVSP